jgi:CRP-like cAMP-binding protein
MSDSTNSPTPAKGESSAVNAVESVIAEHPFLRGLKPEHLRLLVNSALRMHYKAGELIFCEGDPANRFYLIEQGRVSLESPRRDEAPVAVQVIGPGDVLGWSWLFSPYYWHFDARVLEPTTAIFFYGTRLREQCVKPRERQGHDFEIALWPRCRACISRRFEVLLSGAGHRAKVPA